MSFSALLETAEATANAALTGTSTTATSGAATMTHANHVFALTGTSTTAFSGAATMTEAEHVANSMIWTRHHRTVTLTQG